MKKPLLSELSLKEKIAQTMCVRQYDLNQKTEIDEKLSRTQEEKDEILNKNQYGSIWCVANQKLKNVNMSEKNWGNVKVKSADYKEWVKSIDKELKIHALTATDAESAGAGLLFDDLTVVCGGLAIGAANSEMLAYELGASIAKELKCAGINWRWAPVIDISNRFSLSLMRPFVIDDPNLLIKLAIAHIKGMQSENVAATAKHFPGADPYEYRDSHFTQTYISSTIDEWEKVQGKIFQEIIDSGVYSIMTAHTAFPAVDNRKINDQYVPATLSKKIITDLLKNQMGFKGVVITDAINMAGIASFFNREDLLVELIKAGNDVLLGADLDCIDIIEKAVNEGRLSKERINDACQRVLNMKEKIGLFDKKFLIDTYHSKDVVKKTIEVNTRIAQKCITLVCDKNNKLPFDSSIVKNVTIVCSTHDESFFDSLDIMKREFELRGAKVILQRRIESQKEMKTISENSDLIIFAAFIAPHRPKGAMSFFEEECDTFIHAFTFGKEKSIGVSMGYPYIHYDFMANADIFLNTYGCNNEIMKQFVKAVYGEIPIEGKSPVQLNPSRREW